MNLTVRSAITRKPSRLVAGLSNAIKALPWAASIALFGAYILLMLNIIQDWRILTGLAIILSGGLVGLLTQQERHIRHCVAELNALNQARSPRLLTLDEVHSEIYRVLRSTAPSTTVEMNVIALDLQATWTRMGDVARQAMLPSNLQLKMLVITDDLSVFHPAVPAEVEYWIKSVPHALRKVTNELDDLSAARLPTNYIDVEIRKYSEVPFMHGIAICVPIRRAYVTHSRWIGSNRDQLDWGYNKYIRIEMQNADVLEQDVFQIFDSLFWHLWFSATPAYQKILGGSGSLAREA